MFASYLFKGSKFLFQMIAIAFMLGVGCYISCLLVMMQAETRWVGYIKIQPNDKIDSSKMPLNRR